MPRRGGPPGPPGAGKGTQAAVPPSGWEYRRSPPATCCARRWRRAASWASGCRESWRGPLVDDATMADVVRERLGPAERRGFLLDGYPRTLPRRRRSGNFSRRRTRFGRGAPRRGAGRELVRRTLLRAAGRRQEEERSVSGCGCTGKKPRPSSVPDDRERGLLHVIDGNRPVEEVTAQMCSFFPEPPARRTGVVMDSHLKDPRRDRADGPGPTASSIRCWTRWEPGSLPASTSRELDRLAERVIRAAGGVPAFLNYRGYPATLCISVNDVIVHGIPGRRSSRGGGHRRDRLRCLLQGVLRRRGAGTFAVGQKQSTRRPGGCCG